MKYILYTLCILTLSSCCDNSPEHLKEVDKFINDCKERCAPRSADPTFPVLGMPYCACYP